LEETDTGLVPVEEGWFVLNARDARWLHLPGRGARLDFDGATDFQQVGVILFVLEPGEPIGMYHWEADQEDFFVLAGEPLLIVEGEERRLRRWDFVHCPPETKHIILGAGETPSVILGIGAREHQIGGFAGGYPVDEVARRHGAGVERETTSVDKAYADIPRREPRRYEESWLP
jgi:uncharacterized cupin superfamily protein